MVYNKRPSQIRLISSTAFHKCFLSFTNCILYHFTITGALLWSLAFGGKPKRSVASIIALARSATVDGASTTFYGSLARLPTFVKALAWLHESQTRLAAVTGAFGRSFSIKIPQKTSYVWYVYQGVSTDFYKF